MDQVYVVKEFRFEAAHYLPGYDGLCKNMHGHSYKLQVGISGAVNFENGMVMDFVKLKETVNVLLINHLDHVCLNDIPEFFGFPAHMPTAENMVIWMAERLSPPFQYEGQQLEFVKLWETDTSYAVWLRPVLKESAIRGEPADDRIRPSIPENKPSEEMLNVHSVFESISGEAGFFQQGSWCSFIRLQGCNLRCPYCDTKDSQATHLAAEGEITSIEKLVKQMKQKQVLITGGEPLLQPNTLLFIKALLAAGKDVQVETNGTFPIPTEPEFDECKWVLDYKLPSARPNKPFAAVPLDNIPNNVVIKFVISSDADWQTTLSCIDECTVCAPREIPPFIISIIPNKEVNYLLVKETLERAEPDLLPLILFSMQVHKAMGLA